LNARTAPKDARFAGREEAGRLLAARLESYRGAKPIVLALPRGGVPVARQIAAALDCPLDILVARKLGAPHHEELAIGALCDGLFPQQVLHEALIRRLGVTQAYLQQEIGRQLEEIRRREKKYRQGKPRLPLRDASVIVVDDGIATGATMEAALKSARAQEPRALILAVPVAPADTVERLKPLVDDTVVLAVSEDFHAVGQFYEDFGQLQDEEVIALLQQASPQI
jgi:putative phosphoribosyl transferase